MYTSSCFLDKTIIFLCKDDMAHNFSEECHWQHPGSYLIVPLSQALRAWCITRVERVVGEEHCDILGQPTIGQAFLDFVVSFLPYRRPDCCFFFGREAGNSLIAMAICARGILYTACVKIVSTSRYWHRVAHCLRLQL